MWPPPVQSDQSVMGGLGWGGLGRGLGGGVGVGLGWGSYFLLPTHYFPTLYFLLPTFCFFLPASYLLLATCYLLLPTRLDQLHQDRLIGDLTTLNQRKDAW